MRDYLNTIERHQHLYFLIMKEDCQNLLESEALTEEEKELLRQVVENIDKFTISLFKRFGEPYKRKQLNTTRDNRISIVGKFAPMSQAISTCAQEDLLPSFDDYRMLKCFCCKKCHDHSAYIHCPVYAMGIAIDYIDRATALKAQGCPFSMGGELVDDNFEIEE